MAGPGLIDEFWVSLLTGWRGILVGAALGMLVVQSLHPAAHALYLVADALRP